MEVSLSGFLFEADYQYCTLSFREFVTFAHESGYGGVELRRTQVSLETPEAKRRECRSIMEDQGMKVTCMTPRGMPGTDPARTDFFMRYLDLAAKMGCALLKVGGNPSWLNEAAERAADRGIALATNNHINSPTETVAGTLGYFEEVNHPNFGLLYDCCHLMITGEDYVNAIDEFFPFIRNVLVQGIRPADTNEQSHIEWRSRRFTKALVGDPRGQDWGAVFAALRRHGYDGWITVIENGWPQEKCKEVATQTLQKIREIWEKAR